MTRFEIADEAFAGPSEADEYQAALEAQQAGLVAMCAARERGHRWQVEGDLGDTPGLSCQDCPAHADDLMPDLLDVLDGRSFQIGGRTVRFGVDLPGVESSDFAIPVHVEVDTIVYPGGPWGSAEYDFEVTITDREATS